MKSYIVIDISSPGQNTVSQISEFFRMQYLKKELNDEVYFRHADKHRSLLQIDTIILGMCNQACLK